MFGVERSTGKRGLCSLIFFFSLTFTETVWVTSHPSEWWVWRVGTVGGDPQAVCEELLALSLTGWVRGGDTGPQRAWPCVADPLPSGLCFCASCWAVSEGRKLAWARGGSPLELAGEVSFQGQGSVAPTASRHPQIWFLHPGRACRELSVWAPQAPRGRSAGASPVLQCAVPPAVAVSWSLLPEGSGHVECLASGYVRGQGGRGGGGGSGRSGDSRQAASQAGQGRGGPRRSCEPALLPRRLRTRV